MVKRIWNYLRETMSLYYHQNILQLLCFVIPKHASILEVGCGTGDMLAKLNPGHGVGIDTRATIIERASHTYPRYDFHVMDVNELALTKKFDYIILSDIISSLSDIQLTLQKFHSVVHPKSRIIITHYNHLWEPLLKFAQWIHLKSPQLWQSWVSLHDLENLLYLSDFEMIKKGYRMLCPVYVPVISAFCNRYLAKLPLFNKLSLTTYVIARPKPLPSSSPASVSIIIPARNEAGTIQDLVKRIPALGTRTELIFVEGHSNDNTKEMIIAAQKQYNNHVIKIFEQKGMGKGDAVRLGFKHATGQIFMILDADVSVRPEDLTKFYQSLLEGKGDFINGSRLVYPLKKNSMRLLNLVGNKFFSFLFSWILEQPIKDTLCGTKVLWSEDYKHIEEGREFFGNFDPFGDFDLLFGATKLNLKIIDLPIAYQERVYGKTNISRFRHGWLLLKMALFATKKLKFI